MRRGKHGGYREIPLTLDVRKALSAYLHQAHPDKGSPEAPLWFGPRGGLSQCSSVTRLLEKYALQAGIEPVNPGTLETVMLCSNAPASPVV